ncbi:MAG: hypothetical protein KGL13_05050 [Gammaproteobacteria bacterium]|nr:hypothetical protein [Gammaproteobacteria bacterium]MDE2345815.1 hypothetical protein [Gammaproteobacteria bacterium]
MNTLPSHARRFSVLIVGFGQMGHAMQALLSSRARLNIWRVTPKNLQPPASVLSAAEQADFVLLCVPTCGIAGTLANLHARLRKQVVVLSIAKGLDDAGHTAAEILGECLGSRTSWGVLGGPMIANELRAGRWGFAEFGSKRSNDHTRIKKLFAGSRLRLTSTANPSVISWCGVLKNIYVPLIGLGDGLGWGDNLRGQLVSAALGEINLLVERICGPRHAAYGTAGLADLVTTATSRSSHHRRLGLRVAHGDLQLPQCEGSHALSILARRQKRLPLQALPLLQIATALVRRPRTARARLAAWIDSVA